MLITLIRYGIPALLAELAELARKLGALNIGEKDKEDGRRVFSVV